jgi:hypothetical protein
MQMRAETGNAAAASAPGRKKSAMMQAVFGPGGWRGVVFLDLNPMISAY